MSDIREFPIGPQYAEFCDRLHDAPGGLPDGLKASGVDGNDPVLRQVQIDNLRVWLLNADLRTGEGQAALGFAVARALLDGVRG